MLIMSYEQRGVRADLAQHIGNKANGLGHLSCEVVAPVRGGGGKWEVDSQTGSGCFQT